MQDKSFEELLKRSKACRRRKGQEDPEWSLEKSGQKHSLRSTLQDYRARECAYAKSCGKNKTLRRVLREWSKLEKEFEETEARVAKHASKDLKVRWREWFRLRNPRLYREVLDLLKRRMDLHEWFCLLDADGSGEISTAELVDPMLTIGLCKSIEEVQALVNGVDQDGSGEIGFEEFLSIICSDPVASASDGQSKKKSKFKEKKKSTDNPIVQLFKVAADGQLGDECLHFSSRLSNYRRRVILRALAPRPEDYGTAQRDHDRACVNALERLQRSAMFS